ncbi:hypothetical protein IL306_000326 [Fusarium sp. DS 682]|nr:hypothetical protein IL306_000326 [Fusarium sp. DS 682]
MPTCILWIDDKSYEIKKHLKAKYASILGLPLAMAYHDGLTFALGHAKHGCGMYTGWPAKPQRLNERLDADNSNNIRIETRTENFLKADYDETAYSQLKEVIMDIDLPKEIYDKTLTPGKLSEEDLETLKWDGEDVKDDDLYNDGIGLFDPELLEALQESLTQDQTSGTAEQQSVGETVPSSTGPSAKAPGKMPIRVKSNETDYSEGLSAGELDSQWATAMSGIAGSGTVGSGTVGQEKPTSQDLPSKVSSTESRYSGWISPGAMEQHWSEVMGNEMEAKWSHLIGVIETRAIDVSADQGLEVLVDNLRNAKENGDEETFLAVFAAIEQELF